MNKYVYLYELDSACNSEAEIRAGQNALFEEVILNGNIVVLSLNQLTDSLAFLSGVWDEVCNAHFLSLFQNGRLRISRFKNLRTASQYLQQSLERCLNDKHDSFLFSWLPVKQSDHALLQKVHDALRYADISLLDHACRSAAKDEQTDAEKLRRIQQYIRFIIEISLEPLATVEPKKSAPYAFERYLNGVRAQFSNDGMSEISLGLRVLDRIDASLKEKVDQDARNNRTNWLNEIDALEESISGIHAAEAIVNLCYNYAVEESVSGVSKHFSDTDPSSFQADFALRFDRYLNHSGHHFHLGDRDQISEYHIMLPKWDMTPRILAAVKPANDISPTPPQYEENYEREQTAWRWHVVQKFILSVTVTLVYIVMFCLIEIGTGLLEELFLTVTLSVSIPGMLLSILDIILFGILGALFSAATKLPDILESLKSIGIFVRDSIIIARAPRGFAYFRASDSVQKKG